MSEPVHIFNLPVIGLTSGISGNMAASITSKTAYLDESAGFCAQAVFTGSPVGTIKLQGSNDPVNLGYTDITDSITSISAAGSYMINVEIPYYAYVQIVYSRASGTGAMVASINSKRR